MPCEVDGGGLVENSSASFLSTWLQHGCDVREIKSLIRAFVASSDLQFCANDLMIWSEVISLCFLLTIILETHR